MLRKRIFYELYGSVVWEVLYVASLGNERPSGCLMLGASERFRTTRKVRLRFFRGVNRGEGASRSPTEQGEMYVRVSWCCVTVLLTPVHRHSFFKGAFTSEARRFCVLRM